MVKRHGGNKQKVLVVGGAGFTGSKLSRELCSIGHSVLVVDNLSMGNLANIEDMYNLDNFQFIKSDVTDLDIPTGVGTIFFLPRPNTSDHNQVYRTQIEGLRRCLDYCETNITRMVYGSTQRATGPIEGSHLSSDYYLSRSYGETMVRASYEKTQLGSAIVRMPSVYGPGQKSKQIVSKFLGLCRSGINLEVFKEAGQTRSYLHVDDFVEMCLEIMEEVKLDSFSVYELPGKDVLTAKEVANLVKKATGSAIRIVEGHRRFVHSRQSVPGQGTKRTKYKPKKDLASFLEEEAKRNQ